MEWSVRERNGWQGDRQKESEKKKVEGKERKTKGRGGREGNIKKRKQRKG